MYECVCGRVFASSQSYNAHQGRCKINRSMKGLTVVDTLNKDGIPWNKGLTKETDDRVLDMSKNVSNSMRGISHPQSLETRKRISDSMSLVGGGYRKGSGKGKKGWYKGYWCDSSWELAYVVYNIEHGIEFRRNHDYFLYEYRGSIHRYYPDFIEGNTYIEIKGFIRENDSNKFKSVENLKVIDAGSISEYLEYTINKYGEDFIKLYGELA